MSLVANDKEFLESKSRNCGLTFLISLEIITAGMNPQMSRTYNGGDSLWNRGTHFSLPSTKTYLSCFNRFFNRKCHEI